MFGKFRLGKRGTAALNVLLAAVLVVSLAPSAHVYASNSDESDVDAIASDVQDTLIGGGRIGC